MHIFGAYFKQCIDRAVQYIHFIQIINVNFEPSFRYLLYNPAQGISVEMNKPLFQENQENWSTAAPTFPLRHKFAKRYLKLYALIYSARARSRALPAIRTAHNERANDRPRRHIREFIESRR